MSPEGELGNILKKRGLTQYFKKVYPSSWKKGDAINDILRREDVLPHETVFVGDAYEDFHAAQSMNISFVGRNSKKPFFDSDVLIFEDLCGILEFMRGNDEQ